MDAINYIIDILKMGKLCSKLWCFQNQNMVDETIEITSCNMEESREISPLSSDYHMRLRSLTFPMSSNITKITKELKEGHVNQKSASLQQF